MRILLLVAAAALSLPAAASLAQDLGPNANADYIATGSQSSYNRQRETVPLVGLTRRADFLVKVVSFTSDTRDATVRRSEIHTMLLRAINKSESSGLELVIGGPRLVPLTRANYKDVNFTRAGREDTSKADIMIKVPLSSDPESAEQRIRDFAAGLKREGRGSIYPGIGRLLALRNPAQYRPEIVRLIAEDANANAAVFGPDYRVVAEGIDKEVRWKQVSTTDVFMYLPYSYRVVAR